MVHLKVKVVFVKTNLLSCPSLILFSSYLSCTSRSSLKKKISGLLSDICEKYDQFSSRHPIHINLMLVVKTFVAFSCPLCFAHSGKPSAYSAVLMSKEHIFAVKPSGQRMCVG